MKSEVIDKIAALITVAFGLVAALSWNGAIKAIGDLKKTITSHEAVIFC